MEQTNLESKIKLTGWQDSYLYELVGHFVLNDRSDPTILKISKLIPDDTRIKIIKELRYSMSGFNPENILTFIYQENMEKFYRMDASKKDKLEEENNHFAYIPFHRNEFITKLNNILRKDHGNHMRFIDVGCGIGDKVLLANLYLNCRYSTGIEYNKETFRVAENIVPKFSYNGIYTTKNISVINGDATKLDYSPYNLIYMYMPIKEYKNICPLYDQIIKTMPEGGILVEVLPDLLQKFLRENSLVKEDVYLRSAYLQKTKGKLKVIQLF